MKVKGRVALSPNGPCRAVLIYEDFEMAVCGKSACDLFMRETGFCTEPQLTVWNYGFLGTAELAYAARVQAEEADLIVFAARRSDRLPGPVLKWLEDWAPRRKIGPGAFVAVFPRLTRLDPKSSDVGLWLLRAAEHAGMDFFCRTVDPPAGVGRALPASPTAGDTPEERLPRP